MIKLKDILVESKESSGEKYADIFKNKNKGVTGKQKLEKAGEFVVKNWKNITNKKFNNDTFDVFPYELKVFRDKLRLNHDKLQMAIFDYWLDNKNQLNKG